MTDSKTSRAAAEILAQRRLKGERTYDARRAECFAANPRLAEIDSSLIMVGAQAASCFLRADSERAETLTQTSLKLQAERVKLLKDMGKPADYLERQYFCPVCRDTGLTENGRCDCLKKLVSELLTQKVNASSPLSLSSFDDFKLDFYSDKPDERYGGSPREIMADVLQFMKAYAAGFSSNSKSLLLWGNPGLGKTHLALAVAAQVINAGFSAIYLPSGTLFAQLEKERFAREESGDLAESALQCDLLVLDDLGAEFLTPFVHTQIFEIINTRLLTSRPTIVSTNLEPAQLRDRYPERVVSRLTGSYEDLLFVGKDIRIIKKYS